MGELFWTNHRGTHEVVPGGGGGGSLSTHIIYPGEYGANKYGYFRNYYDPGEVIGGISTTHVAAKSAEGETVLLRGVYAEGGFLNIEAYPETNWYMYAKGEGLGEWETNLYVVYNGEMYEVYPGDYWNIGSRAYLGESHPLILALNGYSPVEIQIDCPVWRLDWPA